MDPILTLDAGTTGLKCTLFLPSGEPLASHVSAYGVNMPRPGWAEQPASWLVQAAIDGARQALAAANVSRVSAIGLSGTMNGCLPIDGAGNALYPNIIHSDVRAAPQLAAIRAVISEEDYYRQSGNRLDMHYMLPKLLWLRAHCPDVFKGARCFLNAKDALYGFLTGRHGVTDFSDASLTGALDISTGTWNDPLLRALSIDPGVMPRILPSHDATGRLTREAAGALGLPKGTPVAIGAGDGAAASHGAGLYRPGGAYINIGSSAWLCTLSEKPALDPGMRIFSFFDMDGKGYNICGTVQCAGAASDWAAENLLFPGKPPTTETFAEMEALAQRIPPGAEGLFFLPTLMGERTPWWDAAARGTLIGATLYHHRAHVARAVYEGVAQALSLCDSVMRENGLRYGTLSLVGGGTQSGIWPQMLADMLGISARVHKMPRQATSLGAAMAAAVGVGICASYEEASRMASFAAPIEPDSLRHAGYARHFRVYKALYEQVASAYRSIADYQAEWAK